MNRFPSFEGFEPMSEIQLDLFLADEELRSEADALDPTPEFNESWFDDEIIWSNAA